MHFPVSGVVCPVWLPPVVAFVVALLTTPAGVSGAFLLLPFQMSVLGFVTPGGHADQPDLQRRRHSRRRLPVHPGAPHGLAARLGGTAGPCPAS